MRFVVPQVKMNMNGPGLQLNSSYSLEIDAQRSIIVALFILFTVQSIADILLGAIINWNT